MKTLKLKAFLESDYTDEEFTLKITLSDSQIARILQMQTLTSDHNLLSATEFADNCQWLNLNDGQAVDYSELIVQPRDFRYEAMLKHTTIRIVSEPALFSSLH